MTARRSAPVVAIDGPAGAGKSTVSRRVAEVLGYHLLNTGALYRCVALLAVRRGVVDDLVAVAAIAEELAAPGRIRFHEGAAGTARVLLDGEDVTEAIRAATVSMAASRVSVVPEVRAALLDLQRSFGAAGRVVVEGRDIGTVVFPDAEIKVFLTASVGERASRRFSELRSSGQDVTMMAVEEEVRERDRRDSSRPVAPLRKADDAMVLDSTGRSISEVVSEIVARARDVEAELGHG